MNKITLSLLAILISAQVSAESILDIGDKIRKYRATYPDATKQQLDDYARSLVGQSSSKKVAKTATTARVATLSVIPNIPDYDVIVGVIEDLNPQRRHCMKVILQKHFCVWRMQKWLWITPKKNIQKNLVIMAMGMLLDMPYGRLAWR